jgi:hypothetical protein
MSFPERGRYFDEQAIAAMILAYDLTCTSLQTSSIATNARETIGKQIIEAAKEGERDPNILQQKALRALGFGEAANILAA